MNRRAAALALTLAIVCGLCGCWDYHGLNQLTVVAGMAIDAGTQEGHYKVSFEAVDRVDAAQQGVFRSVLIESEGKTISDAVRQAEKQLIGELFFGNMRILVVSKQLAQSEGVQTIMEEILRESRMRETVHVVISQEDTAAAIITPDPEVGIVVSYEMKKNIEQSHKISATVPDVAAYRIYEELHTGDKNLVLPVFRVRDAGAEGNGLAAFRRDRLAGFLGPDDTLFYLLLMDAAQAGTYICQVGDDHISLTIERSETKRAVSTENGRVTMAADCHVTVFLNKQQQGSDITNPARLRLLEEEASRYLQEKMKLLAEKVQKELETDIFGVGAMLYRDAPEEWRGMEARWDEIFSQVVFDISVRTTIYDTGFIKNY